MGILDQDLLLWGAVALVMVNMYNMWRAQCLVTAATTAAVTTTAAANAASPFIQGGRRSDNPRQFGTRERMAQSGVPTYLDGMVASREQQWDLLGSGVNQNMATAYKGSGGLTSGDRDSMVSYLESLKGGQTTVQNNGRSCSVSNFNNCPQNLAYQCENNKFWNDNAVSEALALSATGALNVPSMEESQLYDILRFSSDGIASGCEGAAAGAPKSGFSQRMYGGDQKRGDLLRQVQQRP